MPTPKTTSNHTIRRVICPCGNDTYRASVRLHTVRSLQMTRPDVRVWQCCNCGTLTPRQVRRMSDATIARKSQQAANGR